MNFNTKPFIPYLRETKGKKSVISELLELHTLECFWVNFFLGTFFFCLLDFQQWSPPNRAIAEAQQLIHCLAAELFFHFIISVCQMASNLHRIIYSLQLKDQNWLNKY